MISTTAYKVPEKVLTAFHIEEADVMPFGSGLINSTWKVVTSGRQYVLQRVNQQVFEDPENIAHNIRVISDYLKIHHPGYCFVAPIRSGDGLEMIHIKEEGFFRLFPFVSGSHSKNVVQSKEEAWEAARQFGLFTRLLSRMEVGQLRVTIPSFHDLELRYKQFLRSLDEGDPDRKAACREWIDLALSYEGIVRRYQMIRRNPDFKCRVTHHDTKISNVLFDQDNKGICVIDLDTVMPGYFISDLGDMLRTYLSPVSEEEGDLSRIIIRDEFYSAVVEGYYSEMKDELTGPEKQSFFYAGTFMTYMQALRFLTDHLSNDTYYGAKYEGHNLVRAQNQLVLLQRLLQKQAALESRLAL